MDLSHLRTEYHTQAHNVLEASPFELLESTLQSAIAYPCIEPHAMTLSTVGADGKPSSRVVLLRQLSEQGLVFFSNYHSRKGHDLEHQPYAAANFFWPQLMQQIRIEGRIERISPQDSDQYFNSRPYESQVASAASLQSQPLEPERFALEQEALRQAHPHSIPRPEHWGGYRLVPEYFEFWYGQPSRAHERYQFVWSGQTWQSQMLYP